MNRRVFSFFSLAILSTIAIVASSLWVSGCHSSPTEPETGYFAIDKGFIESVSGAPTLVTFQCFLDGYPIPFEPVTGAPRSSDKIAGAILEPRVRKGSHTFEIRVLDQVSSPNVYRVHDVEVRLADVLFITTKGRTVLPEATQSLSTGQSIIYQFSI